MARKKNKIGEITYSRIMMAPKEIVDNFILKNGFHQYKNSSKQLIAERMRYRAKIRGKEYYL